MATGRSTRRWKTLAANLRASRHPCWLCGQPINYNAADPNDDDAFSVDHVRPLSLYAAGAEDPSNLRASHQRCNKRRGNNEPSPNIGSTSESW